jgi:hypothetical protein
LFHPEDPLQDAAVGLRPHSGWTALVVVALEEGKPLVLLRERAHLVTTFNYSFRQPYHTAARVPLPEGRGFIALVKKDARKLAYAVLRSAQSKLRETDYRLTHCGLLLASARVLPSLEKILAAHPLIHTADGQLFREALAHASAKLGLKAARLREKELLQLGVQVLRTNEATLQKQLTELGRSMGSPWSQDEKLATLAAWLALRAGA